MDTFFEALKWIVIVLLAGFIGQFGKSFSTHIVDYFKKRKLRDAAGTAVEPLKPADMKQSEPAIAEVEQRLKVEKKALKAQAKAQKKAPGS
jgi:hypothetical protein